MSFAQHFTPAVAQLFDHLGHATSYSFNAQPPVACKVIFDRSIVGQDGYPQVVDGQATLSFRLAEVAAPRANARVAVDGVTWSLVAKTVGDQFHERWTCKRVPA